MAHTEGPKQKKRGVLIKQTNKQPGGAETSNVSCKQLQPAHGFALGDKNNHWDGSSSLTWACPPSQ